MKSLGRKDFKYDILIILTKKKNETNTKTNTQTKTKTKTNTNKLLQRPNVCYIFEDQWVQGFQIRHGHVGHGRDAHGRGGHKDKYKDKYKYKDTDNDKYKVLQRPNVYYIFEEQGVLGEDVRMVDMNMADMKDMDMVNQSWKMSRI